MVEAGGALSISLPLIAWLRRELRPLLRLGQGWVVVLLVFAALGLALLVGYQVRPSYDLPIDSTLVGHRGEPFFSGLYGVEQAKNPDGSALYLYRWTQPSFSLDLPGVAAQPLTLTLVLAGQRPAGQPTAFITVTLGPRGQEQPLAAFAPEPQLREYAWLIPAARLGDDLHVTVYSNGFRPPNDARDLGVIFNRARITPAGNAGIILPPLPTSLGLALALLLLLLALARLGWGVWVMLGAGLAFALVCCLWLIFDRLWLTAFAPYLWQALLAAYIALVIADLILHLGDFRFWILDFGLRRGKHNNEKGVINHAPTESPSNLKPQTSNLNLVLLTIFFAAFAVRLGGELHPQMFVVDLFFHVHQLEKVLSGNLLFKIKSAEWAGHETYYLPTAYLPMVPLYWLTGDKAMAVRIFTVALDTSGLFLVAAMARRLVGELAAVGAALLYVAVPMAVLPFSWGIGSNLFGQYALLWVVALFVCGVPEFGDISAISWERGGSVTAGRQRWWTHIKFDDTARRRGRWPSPQLLAFIFFLTIALLSHPGVVLLAGVALGLLGLARLIGAIRRRQWRGFLALVGAGVVVVAIAYLLYYRTVIPDMLSTYATIQQERQAGVAADAAKGITFRRITGGSVNDPSIGLEPHTVFNAQQWLAEGIAGFFKEAWAYYAAWPAFAALGYALLWRRRRDPTTGRMQLIARFWTAAACIFAAFGLVNNLYVRYALFLLPIIAVGGGLLLARLWQGPRWGRYVAILLAGYTVVAALLLWYNRIMFYQH